MNTITIWVGIGVDDQLQSIRERVAELEQELSISNPNLTLPFHISLKMSFAVDRSKSDEVINAVETYYRTVKPFQIPVQGIEYHETIAWIRMSENETLNRIHDDLNEMLLERFGVGLHEYDRDYLFHATLFMDNDAYKVLRGYEAIRKEPFPKTLIANQFLIGSSETGALGTYHIVSEYSCGGHEL